MQLALEILFRKCFKQHQAICGNKRFQRAQELQLILAKDYSYEESAVQVQLLPTRTHTQRLVGGRYDTQIRPEPETVQIKAYSASQHP